MGVSRREFLFSAATAILVPTLTGPWYRQGTGLIVPRPPQCDGLSLKVFWRKDAVDIEDRLVWFLPPDLCDHPAVTPFKPAGDARVVRWGVAPSRIVQP